ncbi:chemotaxis response regulator protein-glutamate methylesterase [Opitutus sp. ER46]|uniref:protein-glutamate methylesterase/protein-glutamine glutaminase n=1 Tax=Opitutus sp. ER46 TaxID=2161864 RepID=UPI000D2FF0ED|nr:chemotaxis response regulator protein-glutamate methylesterase [Opitutus sp. ER46]PTX91187.1 chemotaxis response regulator protein-glutamate methylesterase [Opitutus sp. ER46]
MTTIRTVVVDDSAFVRKTVRTMLARHPGIEVVGVARDGEEALELVDRLQPDVVTCDLVMPKLDGLGFVRRQMARKPVPILLLTASALDGASAMEALDAGAVDLVQKPTALATDDLLLISDELVAKLEAVARAPAGRLGLPSSPRLLASTSALPAGGSSAGPRPRADVVVIGVSTGGPQALRRMLPELPADFPVPIAMVLHMPVGYTALFAEKLDEICALDVAEARDGDELRPGLALLAPAGRHLTLRRHPDGRVRAQLSLHPLEKNHRPSVDVLFHSAAETYASRVLGVVMTGMGDDGREGSAWIKAKGGAVLTEAESSCIIYGMPRSVVESGLSDRAIPLPGMAAALLSHL